MTDRINISEQIRLLGGKKLADFIAGQIVEGKLKPGMKLPPERELGERFNISRGAVRRVLAIFRQQELISQSIGSGTFVTESAALLANSDCAKSGFRNQHQPCRTDGCPQAD